MSYRDMFPPCSRVSPGEKKIMQISKKSGKHSNGKIYKRISNYIKITGVDVITYALVNFSIAVLTWLFRNLHNFFLAWWDPWARSKRVAIVHLQFFNP